MRLGAMMKDVDQWCVLVRDIAETMVKHVHKTQSDIAKINLKHCTSNYSL